MTSVQILWACYLALSLLGFYFFWMQRLTLESARRVGVEHEIAASLHPGWLRFSPLFTIASFLILLQIGNLTSWLYVIAAWILNQAISALVPLPKKLFIPIYRARASMWLTKPELSELEKQVVRDLIQDIESH